MLPAPSPQQPSPDSSALAEADSVLERATRYLTQRGFAICLDGATDRDRAIKRRQQQNQSAVGNDVDAG